MIVKGTEFNAVQDITTSVSHYSNQADVKSSNSIIKVANETQVSNDNENNSNDKVYTKKDLDKAVKKLNKFLEDDEVHTEYSVHKDLGTIMIKVIDDKTKEVLLEVPSKKILDMISSMCKSVGILDRKV